MSARAGGQRREQLFGSQALASRYRSRSRPAPDLNPKEASQMQGAGRRGQIDDVEVGLCPPGIVTPWGTAWEAIRTHINIINLTPSDRLTHAF